MTSTDSDINNAETGEPSIDPYDMLAWHVDMGADEAINDSPSDWFALAPDFSLAGYGAPTPANSAAPKAGVRAAPVQDQVAKISDDQVQSFLKARESGAEAGSAPKPVTARPVQAASGGTPAEAESAAAAANSLDDLYAALCDFNGGHIKRSSRSTVFRDGTIGAPIMLVGESPGVEEDRQGKPFIGPAGDMLNAMLSAAGLSRDSNCTITNLLPWRLMGKPSPTPDMIAMCLPFLRRHIELAQPKIIVTLGKVSAQALLGSEGAITRFHGRWQDLSINDQTFAAIPTFRPSYLVKSPQNKKAAWQDLLAIKHKLAELT